MLRFRVRPVLAATAFAVLGFASAALAQSPHPSRTPVTKETAMTRRAAGTFDVKLTPQTTDSPADAVPSRMLIDKRFHGDLEAGSKGEMLAAMTAVKGSAGYVAIEKVTGKLNGRSGSFVLQHYGIMERGAQQLTVTVVPDSGTGELAGLSGRMTIKIDGGKHEYVLEYALPE